MAMEKWHLLEARRWWESPGVTPADGRSKMEDRSGKSAICHLPDCHLPATQSPWTQRNFAAGIGGGAQMFAYDFDGNGTNDVFTALAAHRYGVAVFLQNKPPSSNSDLPSSGCAASLVGSVECSPASSRRTTTTASSSPSRTLRISPTSTAMASRHRHRQALLGAQRP